MAPIFRPNNFTNYEKCYPSRLKRYFRSNLNYGTYNDFVPNTKFSVVGNIPSEIIHLFPKETREQNVKEFQKLLGDLVLEMRHYYYEAKKEPGFSFIDVRNRVLPYLNKLALHAESFFNKRAEKLFINEQIVSRIKYIGRGANANVFSLSLCDKNGNKIMHDKALKVFHYLEYKFPGCSRKHGNYAEANFWTFLKFWSGHKLDKTQFTKHYISDMKNGYSLTEFIDRHIIKTTAPLDFEKMFKIFYVDSENNKPKLKKLYDAGGFQKLPNFIDDKVVFRNFKKLLNRSTKELPQVLANMKALAENPKTPHRDKIQKAIELFESLD